MPFLGKTPAQIVDPEVDIDGGSIDGATIGATSASAATVTTFTSTGIDDNATSTAMTIDSSNDFTFGGNLVMSGANITSSQNGFNPTTSAWATGAAFIGTSSYGGALSLVDGAAGTSIYAVNGGATLRIAQGSTSTGVTTRLSVDSDGLKFNGDTAAANALDDYEEGTWTPAFVNGTFTYVGQYGRYTKIGDTIIANASVQYSAKSGTGQTAISLPFTAQSNRFGVSLGYLAGLDNNQVQVSAGGNGGTNTILFWKIVNQGSPQQSLVQNMASSGEIQFSCVYQVAT